MTTIGAIKYLGEGVLVCLFILLFGFYSFAEAKEYDGIWFLGFNVQKPPFDNLKVRQAVSNAIDRNYILTQIISEETMPASFVPPSLAGFDGDLKAYKYNPGFAKVLIYRRLKYKADDPRLKALTLLHTDGVKTVEIAQKIQKDLKQVGLKVELVQVPFQDEAQWSRELASRKHNLFLMGYKADIEEVFSLEATVAAPPDSFHLLEPLFKTGGDVNFTSYSNAAVDQLLDQVSLLDPSISTERAGKIREANVILYKEMPALLLFYIEKL